MDLNQIAARIDRLAQFDTGGIYMDDFLLTWDRSDDEIMAVFETAEIIQFMRKKNISLRAFDSGLAISLFRDNSTRTRFSFASAANLLGLTVQDLDEGKSQIAHGETVRETANMVAFMADVIGIRDDMYIGKGNHYMREVAEAVQLGYNSDILEQRPTLINLQCDIDHPTQSMADALHLIRHFGGIEHLKGKKIAMSWAYSPSYGKPLSVPQGVAGLMTRFGMEVVLAHPEGYGIMPEVVQVAKQNAEASGGSFTQTDDMAGAFAGADIVYPKSWAPFKAMEQRTRLYEDSDLNGIATLEKELLDQNANFKHWECTQVLMDLTKNKDALYLHCLPADITSVSCAQGEVAAAVFDRFRDPLYKQASFKPYIIAAIIFLARFSNPVELLLQLLHRNRKRIY